MLSRITSGGVLGLDGYRVEVEVDLAPGLPTFAIVGLPDAAVRESRERVQAALKNSGFSLPVKRITVNLAPADVRKEGSAFDLPVALGVLVADGILPPEAVADRMWVGELALDGRVKPVRGALSLALAAAELGCKELVVPAENATEASVGRSVPVIAAKSLGSLVSALRGDTPLQTVTPPPMDALTRDAHTGPDFSHVRGQTLVKRALTVAAAGGHNILLVGPPGTGKSLLARCLPGILPPPTFADAVTTTRIHSVAGMVPPGGLVTTRPFRAPHHTISDVGLIGGGSVPRPGEVSLAHGGVLFLDELPEFGRSCLEVLRQPLEDGTVTISRAAGALTYPARLMLVAAMNPCPCGHLGDPARECRCTPHQVARYQGRISGPLLDRIDLQVAVPPIPVAELATDVAPVPGESSAELAAQVVAARAVQRDRLGEGNINAHIGPGQIAAQCAPDRDAEALLQQASERLGLSARGYHRVLRVARTIADLDGVATLGANQVAEAIQYRGALDVPS